MAASLCKKAKLRQYIGLPNTTCLIELGFTIIGHKLYFYIAYLESKEGKVVYILEFSNAVISSILGVFKQLRIWQNVIEYSLNKGPDSFWGGFLKSVLKRLAVSNDGDTAKRGGINGKGTDGGSANIDEGL